MSIVMDQSTFPRGGGCSEEWLSSKDSSRPSSPRCCCFLWEGLIGWRRSLPLRVIFGLLALLSFGWMMSLCPSSMRP
jgi:hypothetical protein